MIGDVRSVYIARFIGDGGAEAAETWSRDDVERYTDAVIADLFEGRVQFGESFLLGFAAGVDAVFAGTVCKATAAIDARTALIDTIYREGGEPLRTDVLQGFCRREDDAERGDGGGDGCGCGDGAASRRRWSQGAGEGE